MPKFPSKRQRISRGNKEQIGSSPYPSGRSPKQKMKPAQGKRNHVVQTILSALQQKYAASANAKNSKSMASYMRNQFEFYGIMAPARRAIEKDVFSAHPALSYPTLHSLLWELWLLPQRELQFCAIDLAKRHVSTLCGEGITDCKKSLDLVEQLITTKSWWDTVDILACGVVGEFVRKYPADLVPVMDSWIQNEHMWLRRTAILHQLSWNASTDRDKLFSYCLQCAHEKEFFIQKAIGWALRNYYRYNPKDVKEFVLANQEKLAKLSVKEALKHDRG